MLVVNDRETTIGLSTVLKHPENSNIVGVIKFRNNVKYLYKLTKIGSSMFIWANLDKQECLNATNDSNNAAIFDTTEGALRYFLDGHEQHELHAFRSKKTYLEFLAENL